MITADAFDLAHRQVPDPEDGPSPPGSPRRCTARATPSSGEARGCCWTRNAGGRRRGTSRREPPCGTTQAPAGWATGATDTRAFHAGHPLTGSPARPILGWTPAAQEACRRLVAEAARAAAAPAVESRPPSTGSPGRRRPCARSSRVGPGAPRDRPVSRKGTAHQNQELRRGLVPCRMLLTGMVDTRCQEGGAAESIFKGY